MDKLRTCEPIIKSIIIKSISIRFSTITDILIILPLALLYLLEYWHCCPIKLLKTKPFFLKKNCPLTSKISRNFATTFDLFNPPIQISLSLPNDPNWQEILLRVLLLTHVMKKTFFLDLSHLTFLTVIYLHIQPPNLLILKFTRETWNNLCNIFSKKYRVVVALLCS